jgi:hypothetical protein
MSLHLSDAAVTAQAKQMAKKKSRKYAIIGAALTIPLVAGGAWAAMTIFGEGSATANKYEAQNLVVSDTSFSKPIFPGVSSNLVFKVTNPNPFAVKVSAIQLNGNPQISCDVAADANKITGPLGTQTSYTIPAADQVEVAPNGNRTVTIPNAVKLDFSATGSCSITLPFKVTGTQVAPAA